MPEQSNFMSGDPDLREWITRLHAEVETMKAFLDKNSYNITRADLDLSNHYRNNNLKEFKSSYITLKRSGRHAAEDFIIEDCSEELLNSDFFKDNAVKGKSFCDQVEDIEKKFTIFLHNSLKQGRALSCEYYHKKNRRAYRIIALPQSEKNIQIMLDDVTLERLSYINVKRYESLFRKAQEISSSGFFQYNVNTQNLFVSEGILNIFESPCSVNINEGISINDYISRVHDDDKEYVISMISKEELPSTLDFEHRILVRKQIKYISIKGSVYYDSIDNTVSLIGTVEDITMFKELEYNLRQVKYILVELEKLSRISYWEYDFYTDRFTGSQEAVRLMGLMESDFPISFDELLNLVHENNREEFYNRFKGSLNERRDWEGHFRLVDKFGTEKDIYLVCRNKFDYQGKPLTAEGFLCDHTKLIQLQKAAQELEKIKTSHNKLKRDFQTQLKNQLTEIRSQDKYYLQNFNFDSMAEVLAQLSARLQNSLNLLSNQLYNWVEAYECNELTPEKFHASYNTVNSQLNEMSQNLGTFRKYYAPLQQDAVFAGEDVMQELVSAILGDYEIDGIAINATLKQNAKIAGNAAEFRSSLMEIIKNSRRELLKRKTEKPEISIVTDIIDNNFLISISDNAGGIIETVMDRMFEPYYTTYRQENAAGLGLYLCKMCLEKSMNGKITAENHKAGALFEISLPLAE
jgi:signal transduction histidine kinase/PAS domain-containing protein